MGIVKSDHRRRRLRLIQNSQERTAKLRPKPRLLEADDQQLADAKASLLMQQLYQECRGSSSAKLRIEHPDGTTVLVNLDRPFLTAGRDDGCDIRLRHEEISPFQSLFLWIDGGLFCCDVAPRNSFFPEQFSPKNGQWVSQNPIDIGPYRMTLVDKAGIPTPEFSPLDRSAKLTADYPYLGLQFDGVKESENLWSVNRLLTLIGRSSQCKLRLNHKSVAPIQAALLRTSSGCWLFDLANDGKIGVNGYSIKIAQVDVGDVLQVGSFQIDVVTVAIPSKVLTRPANVHASVETSKAPPMRVDPVSPGEGNIPIESTAQSIVDNHSTAATTVSEKSDSNGALQSEIVTVSGPLKPEITSIPILESNAVMAPCSCDTGVVASTHRHSDVIPIEELDSSPPIKTDQPPVEVIAERQRPLSDVYRCDGTEPNSMAMEESCDESMKAVEPLLVDVSLSTTAAASIEPIHEAQPLVEPTAAVEPFPVVEPRVATHSPVSLKEELDKPRMFGSKSGSNPAAVSAPTITGAPAPRRTPSGILLPRKAQHKDFDPSKYLTESAPNRSAVSQADATRSTVTPVGQPQSAPLETTSVSVEEHPIGGGSLNRSNVEGTRRKTRVRVKRLRGTEAPSPTSASDMSMIAEFIQQQQRQLAQIKAQLAQLESTYNNAAGSVISYRMRDSLAKPVDETLRCHDSMRDSLEQLLKQIRR